MDREKEGDYESPCISGIDARHKWQLGVDILYCGENENEETVGISLQHKDTERMYRKAERSSVQFFVYEPPDTRLHTIRENDVFFSGAWYCHEFITADELTSFVDPCDDEFSIVFGAAIHFRPRH